MVARYGRRDTRAGQGHLSTRPSRGGVCLNGGCETSRDTSEPVAEIRALPCLVALSLN